MVEELNNNQSSHNANCMTCGLMLPTYCKVFSLNSSSSASCSISKVHIILVRYRYVVGTTLICRKANNGLVGAVLLHKNYNDVADTWWKAKTSKTVGLIPQQVAYTEFAFGCIVDFFFTKVLLIKTGINNFLK